MTTPQELQTKINDLQKQLDEMKEAKEEKPVSECKRWRAKKNGMYWSVDSYGRVIKLNDNGFAYDNWQYKTGNYFQTEQEAKDYKDYLEAKYVIECDAGGYEFTQGDDNFFGIYDPQPIRPSFNNSPWAYKPNTIYFQSKEAIERSQQDYPEEWLTYLTYGMPKGGE